jgi:hypothetical protein
MDASARAGHSKWTRKLTLICGLALAAGCAFAVYDLMHLDYGPVRALRRNRAAVEEYVQNLYAGRIPERKDGQGYYVLDVLADYDARYVRIEGGCVFITFAFFPTDAIPALIYSPKGLEGLPPLFRPDLVNSVDPSMRLYDFRRIDDYWYYMRYDSS